MTSVSGIPQCLVAVKYGLLGPSLFQDEPVPTQTDEPHTHKHARLATIVRYDANLDDSSRDNGDNSEGVKLLPLVTFHTAH